MKYAMFIIGLLAIPLASSPSHAAETGPELKEGDVVALIGNGFIEREAQYGYIETALTARYADRDIKFRNLGWSGDTVWCESRAYFGTPEDGFKHLLEHVDLVKPTVIMLNYGGNEAFAGEEGLQKFIDGYNRLLDELEKRTKRIILMSPTPMEMKAAPSDVTSQNQNITLYMDAIAQLAQRRAYGFINLFDMFSRVEGRPLTTDGIQFAENGYEAAATLIAWLGFQGGVMFKLNMDVSDDALERVTDLRRTIVEKNDLFFHRHRPQNETYLRGFRKHEQGNNAVEIFEFEKLVAEKEAEIARLRGELLKTLQTKEDER